MASYKLSGYETPQGIDSRSKVREIQRTLGVATDGIWGPKTQAAYESSLAPSAASDPWTENMGLFQGYYNKILGAMNVPYISVDVPSQEELTASFTASLRPSTDAAISSRRKRGEANKAELDADAAARGMGASTYVSSMKDREADDVESDIAYIEAQYTATLADKIASAMMQYAQMEASAAQANATMQFNASSTAMGIAGQWYSGYMNNLLSQQQFMGSGSAYSGGSSRGSSTVRTSTASPNLTREDYYDYVSGMNAKDRQKLFNSTDAYWAVRRQELEDGLGGDYPWVEKKYGASTAGGGGGRWNRITK